MVILRVSNLRPEGQIWPKKALDPTHAIIGLSQYHSFRISGGFLFFHEHGMDAYTPTASTKTGSEAKEKDCGRGMS